MDFAFRTDASLQIGTGHVMRCLTLADALRERGAKSTFICRPHAGHLLELIQQRGHAAISLPKANKPISVLPHPPHYHWLGTDWTSDAEQTRKVLGDQMVDWLVVDHYALDSRWEQAMRAYTRRIMVIDDLADRPHECNLLLDQNLGRQDKDYDRLLNRQTKTLIGPAYALLRNEFIQWRPKSLQRREIPDLKNLLITMGGVDVANATGKVLDALINCELPSGMGITVAMGSTAPWVTQVQAQALTMPCQTKVRVGVNNMAQLMAESDLCIGAAGSTSWERCCLGLPTIILVQAANQKEVALALTEMGAALSINLSPRLATDLKFLIDSVDFKLINTLTNRSAAICNGSGLEVVITQLMTM